MRLLFDQNLSHRLLTVLGDVFPYSLHVRLLGLAEADDLTIWNHAKDHDLVIVTQDSDYSDWNKLRGAPPKIVWLRCGNTSVDQMHSKLRKAVDRIRTLDTDPDVEVVEVW
jgi:predicted nuclease of predicted toxin-antitoxin system